ncbi:MAG TPA: metalloregulator ArsR/SmtB family transcription factor [Streptosporangiaceae bacterium]|jgi:ArsR family transcriptional regulator
MSKSLIVLGEQTSLCCAPGAQLQLPSQQQGGPAVCCAPLSRGQLSPEQAEEVAPLLKALADPVRLRLMSLVASHPGGEACVCDLSDAFDLSQPTISHHLKVLHDAGLLDRDKRGVWVYYKARTRALASLGLLIGSPPL